MPDTFGLQTRKEIWDVDGDSGTISSRLLEAARELGGRVQPELTDIVEVKFGSRFSYRMLGILSKPKSKPLVLRLQVEPKSSTTSEIRAEAFSDAGWYASTGLTTSLVKKQYDKAFDRLFDGLQHAVPASRP